MKVSFGMLCSVVTGQCEKNSDILPELYGSKYAGKGMYRNDILASRGVSTDDLSESSVKNEFARLSFNGFVEHYDYVGGLNSHFLVPVQRPKFLVVGLHGMGSDGRNMHAMNTVLSKMYESQQCVFVAPDGLLKMSPETYCWCPPPSPFSFLRDRFISAEDAAETRRPGMSDAHHAVDQFIRVALEKFNIPETNVLIYGFSQGASLALDLAFRRSVAPLMVGSLSGDAVQPSQWLAAAEKRSKKHFSKMEVVVTHGTEDMLIRHDSAFVIQSAADQVLNFHADKDDHFGEGGKMEKRRAHMTIFDGGHEITKASLDGFCRIFKKVLHRPPGQWSN